MACSLGQKCLWLDTGKLLVSRCHDQKFRITGYHSITDIHCPRKLIRIVVSHMNDTPLIVLFSKCFVMLLLSVVLCQFYFLLQYHVYCPLSSKLIHAKNQNSSYAAPDIGPWCHCHYAIVVSLSPFCHVLGIYLGHSSMNTVKLIGSSFGFY